MEHYDVIIVGAGIAGIGAACHLQRQCPGKTYAIVEARGDLGGTWDLFRYPGIRSDSDMHTMGYNFKPWIDEKSIAEGPAIRDYIRDAARENGVDERIRYGCKIVRAAWSSAEGRWVLDGALSCRFLLLCSGYFSYDAGHAPEFPGSGEFNGAFVHPQHWPAELDYRGKRVVVIGSGATAMTLVPAMAEAAAHVTMLQRSPTYVIAFPWRDKFANFLRKVLPMRLAYALTRWKNVTMQMLTYRWARRRPAAAKRIILGRLRKQLGPAIDINAHFTPRYSPWEQRLCLVPDGDLYAALNSGKASVATDAIESFTAGGIKLQSGAELAADIIVSATGIELLMLGGIAFEVDGAAVNFPDAWTYKGMMCSGVPNMLHVYGYINASWTLRADLNAEYFCRLLNHMDAIGARQVTPRLRAQDRDMRARPWIDGFSPGYMRRAMPKFPKQGRAPWVNTQDYWRDRKLLRDGKFDDGALVFSGMAANR